MLSLLPREGPSVVRGAPVFSDKLFESPDVLSGKPVNKITPVGDGLLLLSDDDYNASVLLHF